MIDNIEVKAGTMTLTNAIKSDIANDLIFAVSTGLLVGVLLDGMSWILGDEVQFNITLITSICCAIYVFLNVRLKGKLARIVGWMIFFWTVFIIVMFIICGLGLSINYLLKTFHFIY